MKTLAIITARGGSKRIPHKNIKSFYGRPIIAYSIEAAVNSGAFDTVMVSTDDEQIADISRKYGAEVPFMRSDRTSGDFATTTDVLKEVIEEYDKRGEHFDTACCLYPTAPFITADRLREAVRSFRESGADTLISVTAFSYPPQRALIMQDGKLVFKYPEHLVTRSQALQKEYHDAGQFYVFDTDAFIRNGNLMLGNIIPFELSEMEVQDIDTEVDWELAELKYKLVNDKDNP